MREWKIMTDDERINKLVSMIEEMRLSAFHNHDDDGKLIYDFKKPVRLPVGFFDWFVKEANSIRDDD